MTLEVNGQTIETDDEGYLVNPDDWNREVAQHLAASEELTLSDEHHKVLDFMRAFYDEHQVAADARFVIRFMADEMGLGRNAKTRLFQLFPFGYVKQACKVAGMKRPRAWSTG